MTSRRLSIIATVDHALIAALLGLYFRLAGPARFKSPAWVGPESAFGGGVMTMHIWGDIFLALAAVTAVGVGWHDLFPWNLSFLFVIYAVLGALLFSQGLPPDSSLFGSIMCLLALLSIMHTFLSVAVARQQPPPIVFDPTVERP